MNRLLLSVLAPALLLLASCQTTLTPRAAEGTSLGKDLTFYVAHQPKDGNAVNETIKEQLGKWGRTATTGPLDRVPDDADVLVTYVDRWHWDITMYMLSLDISFRNPMTEEELAGSLSLKTSLLRKDQEWHTNTNLTEVFKLTNPEESPPLE